LKFANSAPQQQNKKRQATETEQAANKQPHEQNNPDWPRAGEHQRHLAVSKKRARVRGKQRALKKMW